MKRFDCVRAVAAMTGTAAMWPTQIASAAPAIPLRISTPAVDSTAQALYAQDLGYFEEAGLDVKLTVQTVSSSVLLSALVGNEVDICPSSCGPVIAARGRGINVRFFYPGAVFAGPDSESTACLLVANDSPIRAPRDLSGKTLAAGWMH